MTLEEQIMKLQTYKMFEGEDTVYVERDNVLKLLEQEPNWIPITKRPMEEDEKPWHESCYDEAEILDCQLPEDGEDVLITANGRTWIDTFIRDETDECYFESYDIDEVEAWMPLPHPYNAESEVQDADSD